MYTEPEHIQARRRALKIIKDEQDYYKACLLLTPRAHWDKVPDDTSNSYLYYATIFQTHLHRGEYVEASAMVLLEHQFNLKARSARRVIELCKSERQLLIMGAASVGKSFGIAWYAVFDWLRDPEYTLINVVSSTKSHARGNIFGQMATLHKAIGEVVPVVGEISKEKIAVNSTSDTSGIFLVGIAEGDQGIGRLRGLHPKPRANPHPIFGNLSRVRTILDEAGEIPRGIWSDILNGLATVECQDPERIKVLGASNPEDPNSEYGQRCEPKGGWANHDDDLEEWESERGWKIFRIDGSKTENVIERKMVCEGLITYEGYLAAMADAGDGSPKYFIMCRGMFPPQGHGSAIVSNHLVQRAQGEWIFEDVPTEVYSLDSALEGGDLPILTFGRFGMAKRAVLSGVEHVIHKEARQVIQIDFQITLGKGDSIKVAENCKDELPQGVDAQWVCVDGTGSGDGVKSALRRMVGMELMSIVYSERPTETKIMFDDERLASQVYKNLRAELWYSAKRWLESQLLLFGPACDVELYRQLTGVRGGLIGGRWIVEKKDKYKNRNRGKSPDNAESAIQIVHLVRQRGDVDAGLFEDSSNDSNFSRDSYDIKTAIEYSDGFTN